MQKILRKWKLTIPIRDLIGIQINKYQQLQEKCKYQFLLIIIKVVSNLQHYDVMCCQTKELNA